MPARIKTCVHFLMLVQMASGSLQLNENKQITNLEIGSAFPLMDFSLSKEIRFELVRESDSSYESGRLVFDTAYIGAETYTTQVFANASTNSLTLGWYANFNPAITVFGSEVFPFIHEKMLLGTGIHVSDNYTGTADLVLPNQTNVSVAVAFLFQEGNESLFLPQFLAPYVDRTVATFYSIPALSLKISTMEAGFSYTIQTWNESYVGIGMAMHQHAMAITYNREQGEVILWTAYDEIVQYSPEIQLFIGFLSLFALAWYLFLLNVDELAFRNNNDHYDLKSILVSYAGTALSVGVLLRQIVVYDLLIRIMYVTDTSVFELSLLVASTIAVVAFIHIYTTWNIHMPFEVRRATYDTLLAVSIASIFVGRTEVCEETVLCFVVAVMWMPFQLMSIVRCPGWGRLILLLQFMLIYPLVAILLVEPLVATVPELVDYTWPSSQMIMFLPPLLLLGLWTVVPNWR